ncbi:MAG: SRPBCC family protein [Pseudomonadales bacterium]|nr:SRPBCC family protein [Pseudomonadales bacterium]
MYPCKEVDLSFFGQTKNCYKAVVEIDATPEQVFDCFEEADAWPAWAPPITHVEWTSPKPFGLGTTRTVSMVAGMVGDEVFIAWEYPKRMAFCFTACSRDMVESFAEDYQVTVLPNGKTQVIWTMAMTVKGAGSFTMPIFAPFMRMANQWMFNRFKKYVENYAKQ